MKPWRLAIVAGLAAGASSSAFGFAEFARGDFLLATTASETYDSRLLGGVGPASDYIFTLDPQLQYRRAAAILKLDGSVGVRINRYQNFTEFNSEDIESDLRLELSPGTAELVSGALALGYHEHTDVNFDVNRRLREKIFLTRANLTIPTGLKTALLLGGLYEHALRTHVNDRDTWDGNAGFRYGNFLGGTTATLNYRHLDVSTSGPGDFGLPLPPGLTEVNLRQRSDSYSFTLSRPIYDDVRADITYGYRVLHRSRAETVDGVTNSGGSIFAINLTGPLLPRSEFPKIESSLSLGYQKSDTPGINDVGGSRFIGSARLSWQAREETRLSVDAHRTQQLSVNNLTVVGTGASVAIEERIGHFLTATASASYERLDYRGLLRSDDVSTVRAGLAYRINRAWSASADYSLRSATSNLALADYARTLVRVGVTYTF